MKHFIEYAPCDLRRIRAILIGLETAHLDVESKDFTEEEYKDWFDTMALYEEASHLLDEHIKAERKAALRAAR